MTLLPVEKPINVGTRPMNDPAAIAPFLREGTLALTPKCETVGGAFRAKGPHLPAPPLNVRLAVPISRDQKGSEFCQIKEDSIRPIRN